MADQAFLTLGRAAPKREPVADRTRHWREFYEPLPEAALHEQGARCMDCGVPFCQGDTGCPVRNVIPEWNALVRRGRWQEALEALHATNNFPEFTGRLCPAPCESACVLGLIAQPVAIRTIEQAIADRGFHEGWIVAQPPRAETGCRVAIVGSGPAGLAAAQQLRRLGHGVDVFEKADRVGGLLRYGIPSFKLEKNVLNRRVAQLVAEGVRLHTNAEVGISPTVADLRHDYDAICLTIGADVARDLPAPGRVLKGIELAMPYLVQQNRREAGATIDPAEAIDARDKHVVIVGGGDTGSDCAGTCLRQGAASVRQFELLPRPPEERSDATPWPLWPMQLRTSHAHEEGCERDWSVSTVAFCGSGGRVRALDAVRVTPERQGNGLTTFAAVPGSEFRIEADLVLLAMGFTGPRQGGVLAQLGVELTDSGLVRTDEMHRTSVPGVFAAGDARRGASLIVWAIREGRDAAASIDAYLRRSSTRPAVTA
ncbi:MAG TPA: glutamate synthase subunit beta [Gemmatimonadaceae bacterium]|nr:glutamate synthase subunit beta [Gemmatimonadaceae bacterium]